MIGFGCPIRDEFGSMLVMETTNLPADDPNQVLGRLFLEHHDKLSRMVHLRLDQRLRGRMDASDVLQQAWVEAVQRYEEYCSNPLVSPFVWMRFLAMQKLAQLHRYHLGARMRQATREVSMFHGALPTPTSASMAAQLVGQLTTPSQAFAREERRLKVEQALNSLSDSDRELLALRHFEQLSNIEAAEILNVSSGSCYKRYVRALVRLRSILGDEFPGAGITQSSSGELHDNS